METFEQSLARLEEIVDIIDNRETDLESAVALYKEGLVLSKTCGDALNRYETEIMTLKKEFDGSFTQVSLTEANHE